MFVPAGWKNNGSIFWPGALKKTPGTLLKSTWHFFRFTKSSDLILYDY